MKNKDTFRLPDGKLTTSPQRLSREWSKIYKPICKELDCSVIGYDPGIAFKCNDGGCFELPTSVATKIAKLIKEKA